MELLNFLHPYVYPEYVLCVIVLVELIKWLIPDIDKLIRIRWLTLVVAIILLIVGSKVHATYNWWVGISSFGFANMGYTYFWEPLKDRFFKK